MSNVAIAYPNRLLELNTLHNGDWIDNSISPLNNITTPILSETGRTADFNGGSTIADKHCSFGLSLKNLPYRTFGAIGLINHNLTTSARCRFTVFNEPPLFYATTPTARTVLSTSTFSATLPLTSPFSAAQNGLLVKLYGCSSQSTISGTELYPNETGQFLYATINYVNTDVNGINITFTPTLVNSGMYKNNYYTLWYVGYANQDGKTESQIVNMPKWVYAWKRMYASHSEKLTWRSKNIWRGCIEEEQRLAFTKIHISFLKDAISGEQPTGTHLHIDLNDATETVDVDNFIELGRVFIGQYSRPIINPEYGSIDHNFIDNSELTASNSGTEYAYEKAKSRTVSVQWNYLTEDEAFGGIYEASRSQGITREVLYAYDVDDTGPYQYARSFVGRFTQLNAITQPNVGLYGASINLKEIL